MCGLGLVAGFIEAVCGLGLVAGFIEVLCGPVLVAGFIEAVCGLGLVAGFIEVLCGPVLVAITCGDPGALLCLFAPSALWVAPSANTGVLRRNLRLPSAAPDPPFPRGSS